MRCHARTQQLHLLTTLVLTRHAVVEHLLVERKLLWRPRVGVRDGNQHLGCHAVAVLRVQPRLTLHVDSRNVDALFDLRIAVDRTGVRTTHVVGQLRVHEFLGHAAVAVSFLHLELTTRETVENLLVRRRRRLRLEPTVVQQNLDRRRVNRAQRKQFALEVVRWRNHDAVVHEVRVDDVRQPLTERVAHQLVGPLKELLHAVKLVAVLVAGQHVRLGAVRLASLRHDLLQNLRRESPRPLKADKRVLHNLDAPGDNVNVLSKPTQHRPRNTSVNELQVRGNKVLSATRKRSTIRAKRVNRIRRERDARTKAAVEHVLWTRQRLVAKARTHLVERRRRRTDERRWHARCLSCGLREHGRNRLLGARLDQ